jgi:hypothetical protein
MKRALLWILASAWSLALFVAGGLLLPALGGVGERFSQWVDPPSADLRVTLIGQDDSGLHIAVTNLGERPSTVWRFKACPPELGTLWGGGLSGLHHLRDPAHASVETGLASSDALQRGRVSRFRVGCARDDVFIELPLTRGNDHFPAHGYTSLLFEAPADFELHPHVDAGVAEVKAWCTAMLSANNDNVPLLYPCDWMDRVESAQ